MFGELEFWCLLHVICNLNVAFICWIEHGFPIEICNESHGRNLVMISWSGRGLLHTMEGGLATQYKSLLVHSALRVVTLSALEHILTQKEKNCTCDWCAHQSTHRGHTISQCRQLCSHFKEGVGNFMLANTSSQLFLVHTHHPNIQVHNLL